MKVIKKLIYLITFVTRNPRKIVGFDVATDKSYKRIQQIADNSVKSKKYYSDGNYDYQKVLYFGKHSYFLNKSQTFTVESINSDIRKYIPFLHRKSKCFCRSLANFYAVFKYFTLIYNKFGFDKFKFPNLKKAFSLTNYVY